MQQAIQQVYFQNAIIVNLATNKAFPEEIHLANTQIVKQKGSLQCLRIALRQISKRDSQGDAVAWYGSN